MLPKEFFTSFSNLQKLDLTGNPIKEYQTDDWRFCLNLIDEEAEIFLDIEKPENFSFSFMGQPMSVKDVDYFCKGRKNIDCKSNEEFSSEFVFMISIDTNAITVTNHGEALSS